MQTSNNWYFKQLKKPEWFELRKRIIERDDEKCVDCGDSDVKLHVHHMWYEYGRKLWEYPDESLKTLCVECHEIYTRRDKELKAIEKELGDRSYLLGAAKAIFLDENSDCDAVVTIASEGEFQGFAGYYKLNRNLDKENEFMDFLVGNCFRVSHYNIWSLIED
jgi:hypothetical protein